MLLTTHVTTDSGDKLFFVGLKLATAFVESEYRQYRPELEDLTEEDEYPADTKVGQLFFTTCK